MLDTTQAAGLVRRLTGLGLREALELLADAGMIKRGPRDTGSMASGPSYHGPEAGLSYDDVVSLCDGHNWSERQRKLYGSDQCSCGSGLSPEECCG
jgi:hypothetical protein